jgi:uncharacterized protein
MLDATTPSARPSRVEGPDRPGHMLLGTLRLGSHSGENEGNEPMTETRNMKHGAGGRLASLTAYDCWALLESEEIARIAWNGREGVAVVPVNYTVGAGALWFRTSPDAALARECGGHRIVIEVDHLEPATRSGWSVVVSGVGELVDAADVPEMLADLDVWPAVNRSLFVRVEPDEVTGRKLLPAVNVA